MYLSGDQVVEGVGISQISRQNESLPITTLRAFADPKQSVTQRGLYLEEECWVQVREVEKAKR